MGCVLGTPAGAGDHRRRRSERHDVASGEGNNAVRVRERARNRHTGDFPGTLPAPERRKPRLDPCAVTQQGWPSWLMAVAGEAIGDWTPRRANTFEKLAKIGQGTYSNVYKAKDLVTGKIVALKKVRFDNLEPESVKFMAREIVVLRRLDHPNVLKLEGLVTSRMSCSLYLVFEYMEHDLAGLAAGQGVKFTEPQFFTTEPYACEPSSLPKYPPSKELDVKLRDEEARRQKALNGKASAVDGAKKVRARERGRAVPAPEANAEIQTNLDRWRVVTHANAKSKSEKFPPPHQDGAVGYPQDASNKGPVSFGAPDTTFSSGIFNSKPSGPVRSHGAAEHYRGRKTKKEESQMASSWKFMRPFKPSTVGLSMDLLFRSK
ncbi:serine/threonine-protein kinase [Spatholobus suberectus]|nr:serine/threonine-protein kinase [Spatholobus suberectus]